METVRWKTYEEFRKEHGTGGENVITRKNRKYYLNHRGEIAAKRNANAGVYKQRSHEYYLKTRRAAMEKLGGAKCSVCGRTEFDLLVIHHKNHDGAKDKRRKSKLLREIINGKVPLQDYSVLCPLCHRIAHLGKPLSGTKTA
jgi:predicted HNH restriction endonuclease